MNRTLLATAICAGLFATGAVYAQTPQASAAGSQDQSAADHPAQAKVADKKREKTLQTITVTGSLIPQATIETATPTITISTQQMERQGFSNVYEALKAQPVATGAVQSGGGTAFYGGFTPGAETISLLGLDPAFTLYLINGHPMADYPLLYEGSSNFVDLSDIPIGMVDHIDIVPGNLSSIYGSSAIAGVINIVLKDHMDGYELNVRGGGFSRGGGTNERIEFLGGYNNDKLKMIYGVQLSNQKPIFGYQRPFTSSNLYNPDPGGRFASPTFVDQYYDSSSGYNVYLDPGASACANVSGLFKGTTGYANRPNNGPPFNPTTGAPIGPGYYCGSQALNAYATMVNKTRSGTGYLNVKYQLNDSTVLYANVLYNLSSIRFTSGPFFWEPNYSGGGYFFNATTGNLEDMYRYYAPEEIGSWSLYSTHDLERTYNAWAGVRGQMEDWNYDVYFARSQQNLTEKQHWPLASAVNDFFQNQFLGASLGTTGGYPIYNPNYANFYKPITPAQYATFNGLINTHSSTWTQNFNIQLTNDNLFELPGGSAGFAGLFQYGEQTWANPTDPGVVDGEYYALTGTSGAGARNNWAFAGEFRAPIFKMLTADLSARYDSFSNHGGGSDNHITYKVGLEFRPFESLLFRANYSTAFRAPDMAYTFGGKSGFYEGGFTDYYRCGLYGGALDQCPYYENQTVFALHSGNNDLKSVTAKSYGAGVVWSPTSSFDVKADYYNIKIANEVELQDINQLLRNEASCRTGQLDPSSPTCIAALAQVARTPPTAPIPNQLTGVHVYPINIANEHVSGVVASLDYKYGMGRFGDLAFNAHYNVTLAHTQQQYPYDPTHDLLRNPYYSSEFKTVANASITWDIGKWSTTLYGTRYGKTPNQYAQYNTEGYATPCTTSTDGYKSCPGTVAPWMLYNASVSYNLTPQIQIRGIVNNIKNSLPPGDSTWTSSPYFNYLNYNVYGRQYWLEFDWKFGQR